MIAEVLAHSGLLNILFCKKIRKIKYKNTQISVKPAVLKKGPKTRMSHLIFFWIDLVGELWRMNARACEHTLTHARKRASHDHPCESGTSPWPSLSLCSSSQEPPLILKQIQSFQIIGWLFEHWKCVNSKITCYYCLVVICSEPLKASPVTGSHKHLYDLWWFCREAANSLVSGILLLWNVEVKFASGFSSVNSWLCLNLMFLKTVA